MPTFPLSGVSNGTAILIFLILTVVYSAFFWNTRSIKGYLLRFAMRYFKDEDFHYEFVVLVLLVIAAVASLLTVYILIGYL